HDPRVLRACAIIVDEGIAWPVLLGSRERLESVLKTQEIDLDLDRIEIVNPREDSEAGHYAELLHERRKRKGVTRELANQMMRDRNHFGMMMVAEGRVDGIVSGVSLSYPDVVRPALEIVGLRKGFKRLAGMYLMLHRSGILFFGDTTVNVDVDAETLADIAEMVADEARTFGVEPRVAMLSFSNFGSVRHSRASRMATATEILCKRRPDLEVEGEMQANIAVNYELQIASFPATRLSGAANVLIFPNLEAGNVAYKLMRELGGIPAVGPVLLGTRRPVTILERGSSVDGIVHMTALTVVNAQKSGS
ncbi:MAG TPA: NADP-dependent malic enzyme, partial [Nannocystis exedens]|nr:NADP-dependent malic enzyme [Nannocystis exedens]